MRVCVQAVQVYVGLMRVSRRRHTSTCSSFLQQHLIVFLLITQHQRIGEFIVLAVGHIYGYKYNLCEVLQLGISQPDFLFYPLL